MEHDLTSAFAMLARNLVPVAVQEDLPLALARGRILAQPLVSASDVPSRPVAAMDGFALDSAQLAQGPNILQVRASILAGYESTLTVGSGDCVRIMTGAPLPAGADAVVMLEEAQVLDAQQVRVTGPVASGAHRRARGELVRAGEALLPTGRRLRPVDLALASSIGAGRLQVFRKLRIGVLSTGDELRDPPSPLPAAGAYDSNRPLLLATLEGACLGCVDLGICPDDAHALARVIDACFAQGLDALLISGGASLGDADVVRGLDGVTFMPVNIRPGRGIACANLQRADARLAVLGLPGNAVAAYVLLHLLALPLLLHMGGATCAPPLPVSIPLAHAVRTRPGRITLQRARLVLDEHGTRHAQALAEQGSAMIRSVCDAQALIALGPQGHMPAGTPVPAYLLDAFE